METLLKKMLFIARNLVTHNIEYMKKQGYGRMGMGQLGIAKAVLEKPGVYADDICKMLELDKATVALGIKRLMLAGYVSRQVDEADKRKKKLFATDKLNDIANMLEARMSERMNRLTNGFTKQELETLEGYLDRIKTNLNQEQEKIDKF